MRLFLVLTLSALLISGLTAVEQPVPDKPQDLPQPRSSGMSSGGIHAPIKDSHSRPITAGGFVDDAPVVFVDITHQSGLDKFHHRSGSPEKSAIIDAPGSGVALLDYDNDGWLDIYLLNGSTAAATKGAEAAPRAMLFHNNHDGSFTDVTAKAGVSNDRWGFGVAVADYDNDGWPDIYVSNYGKNRLYRNNHDGTFTDVAEKTGIALGGWSTGASWGDYDRDGWLDLFVPGYVHYDLDHPILAGKGGVPEGACQYRGVNVFCGPLGLLGESDHLFHNNGDGTFTDVSVKAGVADREGRYGFASVFADIDDDGWPDLIVANDSTPNYLYRNRRDGTFEDISYMSGFALNEEGRAQASMGIALGDYNHSGRLGLFVTTFSDDYKTLYRDDGDASFTDVSFKAGLGSPTIPFLGWGTGFLDFDNDSLLDLFIANGHVYPIADQRDWGTTWAQRQQLFRNLDGAKFQEVPPATGSGLASVVCARGAAFGDLFNDGHIGVVLNNLDSPPTLLRNVVHNSNHWLTLKLVAPGLLPMPSSASTSSVAVAPGESSGPAAFFSVAVADRGGRLPPSVSTAILHSSRDAIGAKVFLTAGGVRQRADVFSGGSFASTSDPRLHFGLGSASKIDKLEVVWPSGLREEVTLPCIDCLIQITEGKAAIKIVVLK
ncbi:MAG TPA: CRTAC1 family protein [Candidatus Acidoferrum sp.]|nr:CRTAC1 family protein [Candidatus Acidoferrum sp.]